MSKAGRNERRAERLQAIGDAVITLVLYGMTWIVFMMVISKMLKIM